MENLKVVDEVVMVGAEDEVDVIGVVLVVEEVKAGVEAGEEETLKIKLQQSYQKLPKMKLISSLMPWKLLQQLLALSTDPSQTSGHPFLLLPQILLFLLLTQGSNKILNI